MNNFLLLSHLALIDGVGWTPPAMGSKTALNLSGNKIKPTQKQLRTRTNIYQKEWREFLTVEFQLRA